MYIPKCTIKNVSSDHALQPLYQVHPTIYHYSCIKNKYLKKKFMLKFYQNIPINVLNCTL